MGMTPADVLAGIDGWAGASVSVLSGGLSNHTWLVEKDGRTAVLKIDDEPRGARTFDAAGAARDYARQIEEADERKVRECLDTIESAPRPLNLHLCHNDLVAENIISTPEIRFLDWEYASDNDPLFDLATVAAHHGLSPAQRSVLLDAYFGGDASQWHEPFAQQAEIYEALLYLWRHSRS